MCGENSVSWSMTQRRKGSPPRVRGKPSIFLSIDIVSRITPACAGKTLYSHRCSAEAKDHPRVCGENLLLGFHHLCSPGSPPRVRGKRSVRRAISGKQRITPACAGKTGILTRSLVRSQDHPRVCGENLFISERVRNREGSPPRVRGKLRLYSCLENHLRITPACAGKTFWLSCLSQERKDHPRVCGENFIFGCK